jgi:hypothetical protein
MAKKPTTSPTLDAARRHVAAGLSVIRVRGDGSKAAIDKGWRKYTDARPTDEEMVEWFAHGNCGIGIPGGPASGNLVILDFEDADVFERWFAQVASVGLDADVRACPLVESGGGGRHLYCRLETSIPGFVFARKANKDVWIETRGAGQYVVGPGSPASVHSSGRPYAFLREAWAVPGPRLFAPMPNVVFDALCKIAEGFNEWTPPEPPKSLPKTSPGSVLLDQPGADFSIRGTWEETGLFEKGWTWFHQREGEVGYLIRPGKKASEGKSASVGVVKSGHGWPLFWPFTANADPFRDGAGYSRFAVLALLKHGGDYSAAASYLRGRGYGSQRKRPPGRFDAPAAEPAAPPAEANGHAGANGKPPPGADRQSAPPPRRLVGPFKPFPLDTLAPVLRDYVGTLAQSIDCDPVYPILPTLALTASAVGNLLTANPRYRWNEPAALWTVVVADSGTAKSPAADHVEDVAEVVEDQLATEYANALREWEAGIERDEYTKASNPPPKREYFRVENITIERLIAACESSPRGLFLLKDELSGWFSRFSQYKGKGGGSDVGEWCALFEGRSFNFMRRTGEQRDIRIRRGLVSVCGGIQPKILAGVLRDESFIASGLAARLLFTMPPKHVPRWRDEEPDRDALSAFAGLIDKLRAVPFADPPARITLSLDALDQFRPFMNEYAEAAENHDGGPLAAALPKAARIALRLALSHYAATAVGADDDPTRGQIGAESMAAAIRQSRWFANEAARVYGMLEEGEPDRDARLLSAFVARRGGRATPRDLCRANARRYPTTDFAEAALEALTAGGFGRWTDELTGGRPTRYFELLEPSDAIPEHSPED